jgi:hypothetical protein
MGCLAKYVTVTNSADMGLEYHQTDAPEHAGVASVAIGVGVVWLARG